MGFPPHGVPKKFSVSWLYDTLAKQWLNWLPNSTENVIKWRASYAVKILPKLRIISLNTQYCDLTNFLLYLNTTDPDGTLHWLVDQLADAEKLGDKVHIIGHIPSGNEECMTTWARNYYDIVNRFENTIRGQFFGHSHKDSFAVFYEKSNPKGRPTNVMYISPSVTTFINKLPSYRIYTIDGNHKNTTWTVLDHETYVFNLTKANSNGVPEWMLEYRAMEAYKMNSTFPNDWNNLITRFTQNDTMFKRYYRFYNTIQQPCGKDCRFFKICELRSGKRDPKLCSDLKPIMQKQKKHRKDSRRHLNHRKRHDKLYSRRNRRINLTSFKQLRSLWDACKPKPN